MKKLLIVLIVSLFLTALLPNSSATLFESNIKVDDDSLTDRNQFDPTITIDDEGTLYTAWYDGRSGTEFDIYFSKSSDNGITFSSNVKVNSQSTGSTFHNNQLSSYMAVDTTDGPYDGNIYIAWEDERDGTYDIYFAKSTNGGVSFGTNKKVNDDGSFIYNQIDPSIKLDGNGMIYLVWSDARNGNWDIYFAKSTDGGTTFSTNVRVDDSNDTSSQTYSDIAVDNHGNIYVVWQDNRSGEYNIYMTRSMDGGKSFEPNIRVTSDASYHEAAQIEIDSKNNIFITWDDNRTGYNDWNIYLAKSTDGGITFTETRVDNSFANNSNGTNSFQTLASLAIDGSDNIHVAWHDNRSGDFDVLVATSTNGGHSFGPNIKVNDDTTTTGQSWPCICVDNYGSQYIIWYDYRSDTSWDIYFSKADLTAPKMPTGLVISLHQNDIALNITWDKNNEPDVSSYTLYKCMDGILYDHLKTLSKNDNWYNDTAVAYGEKYYYFVIASDDVPNHSPYSIAVTKIADLDTDLDGIGNLADHDDDDDGIVDLLDAFPLNKNEWLDTDLDNIGNELDNDDDNDGVIDSLDIFPLNPSEYNDSDLDGIGDNCDPDDDDDGYRDLIDDFPLDDTEWRDSDHDGFGDNSDSDDDNDGVSDLNDDFPYNPMEYNDTDADGLGDNCDPDDDDDGYHDYNDDFPLDDTEWRDFDSDGIGDNADLDDDNDGILDAVDSEPFNPLNSIQRDINSIKSDIMVMNTSIFTLQSYLIQMNNSFHVELSALSSEINTFKTEMAGSLQEIMDSLDELDIDLTNEIKTLNDTINNLDSTSLADIKQQLVGIEQQISEIISDTEVSDKISTLSTKIDTFEADIKIKFDNLTDLLAAIDDIEKDINGISNAQDDLTDEQSKAKDAASSNSGTSLISIILIVILLIIVILFFVLMKRNQGQKPSPRQNIDSERPMEVVQQPPEPNWEQMRRKY